MTDNLKYRFFVEWPIAGHAINRVPVTPLNAREFKLITEQETDSVFFRTKFAGEVVFGNKETQDYDLVHDILTGDSALDVCTRLYFVVEKNTGTVSSPSWEQRWYGYFSVMDCTFDDDSCELSFTPTVWDGYEAVIAKMDDEINLYDCDARSAVTIDFLDVTLEYVVCTEILDDVNEHSSGGCWYIDDINTTTNEPLVWAREIYGGNGALINMAQGWQIYEQLMRRVFIFPPGEFRYNTSTTFFREYAYNDSATTPPAGSGWINVGTESVGGQTKYKWVRKPYGGIYVNYTITGCNASFGDPIRFNIDLSGASTTYTFSNGRELYGCLDFIVDYIGGGDYVFGSDFFGANPNAVLWDNEQTAKTLRWLQVHQASDIKNPTATEEATNFKTTPRRFISDICNMFNLGWFIDNNLIRLEHVSHPLLNGNTTTTDLRQIDNGKWIYRSNKYSFDVDNMPNAEQWSFTVTNANEDFVGVKIDYDKVCTNFRHQPNILTRSVDKIYTDVQLAYTSPNDVPNEGFFLIDSTLDGYTYGDCIYEVGKLSGVSMPNAHLAIANLQYHYWRHKRVQETGLMNNVQTTFITWIKTLKQIPVSCPSCFDVDPYDTIKTDLGNGEIVKVTEELINEIYTFELIYNA